MKHFTILILIVFLINYSHIYGQVISTKKSIEWTGWEGPDKTPFIINTDDGDFIINYQGQVKYNNFTYKVLPYSEGIQPFHIPMEYMGMVYKNYLIAYEYFATKTSSGEYNFGQIIFADYINNVIFLEGDNSAKYFIGSVGIDNIIILLYITYAIGFDIINNEFIWSNDWIKENIEMYEIDNIKTVKTGKIFILKKINKKNISYYLDHYTGLLERKDIDGNTVQKIYPDNIKREEENILLKQKNITKISIENLEKTYQIKRKIDLKAIWVKLRNWWYDR